MRRHPSAYLAVARKNASSQASQKRTWARCGRVVGALAIFNEKWVTQESRNPFILLGCVARI
jgi:hypothetical protein